MWKPPTSPSHLAAFRGAVVQHAIAVSVRRWKNNHKVSQQQLADQDVRGGDDMMHDWNRRLNGRRGLTTTDIAVIARALPDALPSQTLIALLLDIAEKRPVALPSGWREVDA